MLLCDNIENKLNMMRDEDIITNNDKEQIQIMYEELRTNIQIDYNPLYEELDKNIIFKSLKVNEDIGFNFRKVFKDEDNVYKLFRFNIKKKINGEKTEIYIDKTVGTGDIKALCLIMKEIYFHKLAYDKSKTIHYILVPKIYNYGVYIYNDQQTIGIYLKMEYIRPFLCHNLRSRRVYPAGMLDSRISPFDIDITDNNSKILYIKQLYKLLKKVRKFFIDNKFHKNDCGYVYNYINKLLVKTTNKIDYIIENPLFINEDLFHTLFGDHNNVYLHSNIHIVLIDFETSSRLEDYNQLLCSSQHILNLENHINM